ncbi:hypothetical protein AMTRI_Chr11g153740 [Amborella trichopoda]
MIIEFSIEIGISHNFWPHLRVSIFHCLNTFEVHSMSSVSISVGGYQWRTCPRCNLQCKLSTSSSRSNPGGMYYRYTNWMNYNINLRRRDIHQNNQSQESQECITVKLEPIVIQQQIIDTLRCMKPFLVFLCVERSFMFILQLLKSV